MVTKSQSDVSGKLAPSAPSRDLNIRVSLPLDMHVPHCSLCAPSLPDEAVISDVGRYHVLSANQTTRETYQELFQSTPFRLNTWIPPHIAMLAKRMPGNTLDNATALLQSKTLFPLCQTFSNLSISKYRPVRQRRKTSVDTPKRAHRADRDPFELPKRLVIEPVRLCLNCLHEDAEIYGVPYIHLSHQVPGVQVCSKHGVALIHKCPFCECFFVRPNFSGDLVLAPWRPCHCKKHLLEFSKHSQKMENFVALSYAKFASDLLFTASIQIQSANLVACYKRRILELGYTWGENKIHRTRLFTELEQFYGQPFLECADPAYKEKRLTGWFMLINENFVSEVPISRHLIFAHFLFRNANQFWHAALQPMEASLAGNHTDQGAAPPRSVKRNSSPKSAKRERTTELIRELLRTARDIPNCTIEDLWKVNFREMKWLVRSDVNAFSRLKEQLKALKPTHNTASSLSEGPHPQDGERQKAILGVAEQLYGSPDKPEHVSGNRLSQEIGWQALAAKKHRFPSALREYKEQTESNWYFYARRIIWAMLRYKHAPRSTLKLESGVEYHRAQVLLDLFQDLERSTPLKKGTVVAILAERGIDRHWQGPCPDRQFLPAGRSFYHDKKT